jgi:hypothetical protein
VVSAPDGTFVIANYVVDLRRITADGEVVWRAPGAFLMSPALTLDGGVVAWVLGDQPGVVGESLVRVDAGGHAEWTRTFPPMGLGLWEVSPQVRVTSEGDVVAASRNSHGTADLVRLSPAGDPVRAIDTGLEKIGIVRVLPGDDVLLTALEHDEALGTCTRLRLYSPTFTEVWEHRLDQTCGASVADIVATEADSVVLVGHLVHTATFDSEHVLEPAPDEDGFVLRLRW